MGITGHLEGTEMNADIYIYIGNFYSLNILISLKQKNCLKCSYLLFDPCATFETFTAVMFQVDIFWVVTSYNIVVRYQCFRGPCCLHLWHELQKQWYPTTILHGITTQETST